MFDHFIDCIVFGVFFFLIFFSLVIPHSVHFSVVQSLIRRQGLTFIHHRLTPLLISNEENVNASHSV